MKVQYDALGLAQQVLTRQGDEHIEQMKVFTNQWCAINGGEMGGMFSTLVPLNNLIVAAGMEVLNLLAQAHADAGAKMKMTIAAYAEADREAWEKIKTVAESMGEAAAPYSDPRSSIPTLGTAARRAGKYYGGGDPLLWIQCYQDGKASREYIEDQVRRSWERSRDLTTTDRSIQEEQDPQSYLVAPETPTSEMENLRWSAGALIGGLDWVFEKLFGWSLLNDFIYKQIVGDWRCVDRAATAWEEIDTALVAVGQNDSGILPALSEWIGKGAEACNAFITVLSATTTGLSYAAGAVGGVISKVALAVKLAAIGLGTLLKKLSYKLARIAAEAAVPVVGWAVAAAECAILVSDIIGMVRIAYAIVNTVYDAISGLVEAKTKIVEVSYTVLNIVEAAGRGGVARA